MVPLIFSQINKPSLYKMFVFLCICFWKGFGSNNHNDFMKLFKTVPTYSWLFIYFHKYWNLRNIICNPLKNCQGDILINPVNVWLIYCSIRSMSLAYKSVRKDFAGDFLLRNQKIYFILVFCFYRNTNSFWNIWNIEQT